MKNLSTNISINATTDEVWYSFSKFHAYELWNPFIGNIDGEVSMGAKLMVTLSPSMKRIGERMNKNVDLSGGDRPPIDLSEGIQLNKASHFRVKVTRYLEGSSLRWEKRSWFLGTYIHEFHFRSEGASQTLFENNIQMSGFLINLG